MNKNKKKNILEIRAIVPVKTKKEPANRENSSQKK